MAPRSKAWNDYHPAPNQLAFWRTRSGVEVDFIVYGPDGFLAIEVKNGATVRPADLRGLKTFHTDYPESTPILLYRGKERLAKSGVLCVPCEEFLAGIHPDPRLPVMSNDV